jgi:hypothetical protein
LSSSRLWLTLVVDLVDVLMCIGNWVGKPTISWLFGQ